MNIQQKKYLLDRLEEIRREKQNNIKSTLSKKEFLTKEKPQFMTGSEFLKLIKFDEKMAEFKKEPEFKLKLDGDYFSRSNLFHSVDHEEVIANFEKLKSKYKALDEKANKEVERRKDTLQTEYKRLCDNIVFGQEDEAYIALAAFQNMEF